MRAVGPLELVLVVLCFGLSAAARAWVNKRDAPPAPASERPLHWGAIATGLALLVLGLVAVVAFVPTWVSWTASALEGPVLVSTPAGGAWARAVVPLALAMLVPPLCALAWLVVPAGRQPLMGLATYAASLLGGASAGAIIRRLTVASLVTLAPSAGVEPMVSLETYVSMLSGTVAAAFCFGAVAGALGVWSAGSLAGRQVALRLAAVTPAAFALVAALSTPPGLASTATLLVYGLVGVALCTTAGLLYARSSETAR